MATPGGTGMAHGARLHHILACGFGRALLACRQLRMYQRPKCERETGVPMPSLPRRFPPPWSVRELGQAFVVSNANIATLLDLK